MIKNQDEYTITQQWVQQFEGSLAQLERNENEKAINDPELRQIYLNEIERKLEDLKKNLQEYQNLTSHDPRTPILFKIDEINQLPELLIKSRIAAKLSQKELADLAGLTEEQIKQYEEKDYEDASFLDVLGVFEALDIQIQQGLFLVPLDTLRRTPITKEELLSSSNLINCHVTI